MRGRGVSNQLLIVSSLFITLLITANITAVKLVTVLGITLPAGILVFPASYILGDIITEVYGLALARRVIWLGFLCNGIAVLAIAISIQLPAAAFWNAQTEYERILGMTPRILIASFSAYLAGENANALILAKLKQATGGRFLWIRTIGSTIVGEGIDSAIFVSLAFWGQIPTIQIGSAVVSQWLVKTAYETIATPLTYFFVNRLKKAEGYA